MLALTMARVMASHVGTAGTPGVAEGKDACTSSRLIEWNLKRKRGPMVRTSHAEGGDKDASVRTPL